MRSSASVMDRTKNSNSSSDTGKRWSKVFNRLLHVKYIALIKQVLVLLYVLRAIHANLELDVLCYDTTPTTSEVFPRVKICLRPSCLWLHWVVLRLPQWLVHEIPESVCTGLLFFTLLSSFLMLFALYRREVEKTSGVCAPLWLKITMVFPSVLIEVGFMMLMCNGIISGAWHWRSFEVSKSMMALAVAYAVVLCCFVCFMFLLHAAAVIYVCRQSERAQLQHLSVTDYSADLNTSDSPTTAMLAMLKYQAEAERAPLISPPDGSLMFHKSVENSLDMSQVNSNDRKVSHAYTPSPKKLRAVDSPPYARLRPSTFHVNSGLCSTVNAAPSQPKSHGLDSSFRSDYSRTKPYDLWKVLPTDSRPGTISLHEYSSLE